MPEHLLLDMGQVLLTLDYRHAWARMAPHCPNAEEVSFEEACRLMINHPATAEYELGRSDILPLYQIWMETTGFTGSLEDFCDGWCSIFSRNRPMLEFAEEQSAHRPVHLLTNSNELHIEYVFRSFPELSFHRELVVSSRIGALKPAAAFYQRALDLIGIRPEDGLFVDDRLENIEGARACGIQSSHYQNAGQAIKEIRKNLS